MDENPLCLDRYDCYLNITSTYNELGYEMASVLYNSGALHAQQGAKEAR